VPDRRVLSVSAHSTRGVPELVAALAETLAALPEEPPAAGEDGPLKVYRLKPEEEGWTVECEGDDFRVRGKRVERIVAMTDMTNPDAVEMLQRTLGKLGVFRALEEAGVQSGNTVHVGQAELEWE
jgi:GTP-binding protein